MKNGSARAGLSLLIALLVSLVASVAVASPIEDLAAGFEAPPDAARPWVYWFWLNGNITAEGITADLEAMARQGIGGVLIMEVDQGAPLGPVAFASPEWRKLFAHVVREAHRLGLEVNMNNDAGWCGSGACIRRRGRRDDCATTCRSCGVLPRHRRLRRARRG